MNSVNEVNEYIKNSYEKSSFNPKCFSFYKTRREKGQNRVGILDWNNKKYFFKIVTKDEYNDEEEIADKIRPYFKIVKKYSEYRIGDEILNLYEYIDAPKKNAFNYLRNKNISLYEKEVKLNNFFDKKIEFMNKTCRIANMTGSKKADRWFFGRMKTDGRFGTFYGNKAEKLLGDINELYTEGYHNYYRFLNYIFGYMKMKNKTVESYCHGDFHDFNFSLDGLFWDTDTFGMNPILNDFTVYYWHFCGREDSFVYKYSPWLTNYMYDSLSKKELDLVRGLKEKFILKWYSSIEELYKNYDIIDGINSEFIFKLFCRIFLISNILDYKEEDRKLIYKFFNYYLENKDKCIKDLLFTNPVKFPYGAK